MKKLFFAAIASIVMVSVSNAFAHEYVMNQTFLKYMQLISKLLY